jgi:hypothetical protein
VKRKRISTEEENTIQTRRAHIKKVKAKRYEHIVICKTRHRRRKESDYIEFVRVVKRAITLAFLLF